MEGGTVSLSSKEVKYGRDTSKALLIAGSALITVSEEVTIKPDDYARSGALVSGTILSKPLSSESPKKLPFLICCLVAFLCG